MAKILYNVTHNEGEPSSITVFIGADSFVATPDHANFKGLIELLDGGCTDAEKIKSMWNVGAGIAHEFQRLSERVTYAKGRLFLDNDPMDDALAQTIVRFIADGNDDYKPLVAFVEKIVTNPQPHSREHLFRWLREKHIGICPDGDFVAYKGIRDDDKSVTAGTAMVNGKTIAGHIPNLPDTVIEMPRSKVTFDPRVGCSTGLHAGNWRYASGFGPKVVVVKINPRDVVSVPTDSNDEKLRVSRYKVLRVTQAEDNKALFVPDIERLAKVPVKPEPKPEKPKRNRPLKGKTAGAKKPAPKPKPQPKPIEYPRYYEEFTKKHFDSLAPSELRWVAKEFEIVVPRGTDRDALIQMLLKEARARKRTW